MTIVAARTQAGIPKGAIAREIRVRKGRFPFTVGVDLPQRGLKAIGMVPVPIKECLFAASKV
jgi:hypothetical protein